MRHGNLLSRVKIIARIYNLHIFVEIYYGAETPQSQSQNQRAISGTGASNNTEQAQMWHRVATHNLKYFVLNVDHPAVKINILGKK